LVFVLFIKCAHIVALWENVSVLLTLTVFIIPEEMIVMPGETQIDGRRVDVTFADHPLNLNPDSQWQTFFRDNEVLLQIDKDVR
jgi:hypothetical protein